MKKNVTKTVTKSESKYFNTACLMDKALILLLDKKNYEYITVKDICEKAGVNRSTFYLHYETKEDLLAESYDYICDSFFEHMRNFSDDIPENIFDAPLSDLFFITPKYLTPFFGYIKENRLIFSTVLKNIGLFQLKSTYAKLFKNVFNPILARFNVTEPKRKYIMAFTLQGLNAIVSEWLQSDCKDSIEEVVNVTVKCVNCFNKLEKSE